MKLRDYKTVAGRRKALEKETGIKLPHIGTYSLDDAIASSQNCENMIGVTQIPLGVAGPLVIKTTHHSPLIIHNYYIPLATTEGALVASINRGCKAITESGGVIVDSYRAGSTRGPVFKVKNLVEGDRLNTFLEKNLTELKEIAKSTSNHLHLMKLMSRGVGKYRFVRFIFDTQDAMGMNMTTIATQAMVKFVEEKTGAHCVSLAGNYDIDKKPAWLNFIEARGIKVWAEVTIPASVLQNTLKTTAKKIYDVWLAKCMIGSVMSGSLGFNAQFANVVAALFLATGQDPGHIGEGSMGITTTEVVNDSDLYISVYLPDLMVGTVGGGTGLATQKEALELFGVAGGSPSGEEGRNAQRFAEIVGGAVLAGEISLLSSLTEGTLARAHKTLARGGK